jgi:hypothetical protein
MFACQVEVQNRRVIRHKKATYEWIEKGVSEVSRQETWLDEQSAVTYDRSMNMTTIATIQPASTEAPQYALLRVLEAI